MKKTELLCSSHIDTLLRSAATSSIVFDTDKVLQENVEKGLTYNLNSYQKCMSALQDHKENNIETQYCLVQYNDNIKNYYSGLCYPRSCHPDIIEAISKHALEDLERNLTKVICRKANYVELEAGDYVAIVFFSFWLIVVMASTLYDYIMLRKELPPISWLTTFSLYTNIKRIFTKVHTTHTGVNCLYAIRTLSILWLIISDRFNIILKYPLNNEDEKENWIKNGFSTFLVASDVAYDSLFIVSGFLLALYCFRAFKMKNLHYLPLLIHRYIRYMPMVLLSLVYHLTLMKFSTSGPFSFVITERIENCKKYGFTALVIVENFMGTNKLCLFHGWYFSIDFQYFIISPIFVFFCHKSRKIGFLIIGVLTALIYALQIGIIIDSNMLYDVYNRYSMFHLHSYFRCAPWFGSIILASSCLNEKIQISNIFRIMNAVISVLLIAIHFIYSYAVQNENVHGGDILVTGIYAVIHRLLWSLSICMIIFHCYKVEANDWFQRVMNMSMWKPLAKLTLSMLIIYPIYQNSIIYSRPEPFLFDSWEIFHAALGDILMTIFLALLLNAGVEMPFVMIEQLIFEKRKARRIRKSRRIEVLTIDPKNIKVVGED